MNGGPYYYDVQEGYCGSKEDYYDDEGHLYDDPYNMWINKLENLKAVSRGVTSEAKEKKKNHFAGKITLNSIEDNEYLWGGIENPLNSNVNLLIDTESITNFTDDIIEVETWVNSKLNILGIVQYDGVATDFTTSNIVPKCNLRYNNLNEKPIEGINLTSEIVASQSTLLRELNGKYILPPGGSYIILIKPLNLNNNINISLTWWEEEF